MNSILLFPGGLKETALDYVLGTQRGTMRQHRNAGEGKKSAGACDSPTSAYLTCVTSNRFALPEKQQNTPFNFRAPSLATTATALEWNAELQGLGAGTGAVWARGLPVAASADHPRGCSWCSPVGNNSPTVLSSLFSKALRGQLGKNPAPKASVFPATRLDSRRVSQLTWDPSFCSC